MPLKVYIITVMLSLALYFAYYKNKNMDNAIKDCSFISFLIQSLENNQKTKMLPLHTVLNQCIYEKYNLISDIKTMDETEKFLRELYLDKDFLDQVIENIKNTSHSNSGEIIKITEDIQGLTQKKLSELEEKKSKNGKVLFLIYPLFVLALSIMFI